MAAKDIEVPHFRIRRDAPLGRHPLSALFEGIEQAEALQRYFGGRAVLEEALRTTDGELVDEDMYMYIDDSDGHLVIGQGHLRDSDLCTLYLDVIHELAHIRQYRQGLPLYDERYSYVERPTEVEAYEVTVKEARRLGLSEPDIKEYLYVEWISKREHEALARRLGVMPAFSPRLSARAPSRHR